MNYNEAVEYILDIPKYAKKNTIENTKRLLQRTESENKVGKIIHVAGTNGKGSVCAYLSSILNQAGYRVGLFTSPHLVHINERFQINGVPVSDEEFLHAFHIVYKIVQEDEILGASHPTFFEWLFAMGMVIFGGKELDFCILETGLGGRLDATNSICHPEICVITSIGLDHTEFLGDTIGKIASEKAGICKTGVPVIFDGTNSEAAEVIEWRAKELDCDYQKLVDLEPGISFSPNVNSYQIISFHDKQVDFLWNYGYDGCIEATIPGIAFYQAKNATLAMMTVKYLLKNISEHVLKEGIRTTFWQGRMEELFPDVYLDGAHNPDGIAEFIRIVKSIKDSSIILLFTAVKEKDIEKMIEQLCHIDSLESVYVTEINNKRAVKVEELETYFKTYTDKPVFAVLDLKEAMKRACKQKGENSKVFCVGSLYLIGEIKTLVKEKKL